MISVSKKLLIISCVTFSQFGFAADPVEKTKPDLAPKTEAAKEETTKTKNIFPTGKSYAYLGISLTNSASAESTINNTSTSIVDDYKLKTPGLAFGFEYMPVTINDFQIGAGFMYELQRDLSSYTEKVGTGAATTYSNPTIKFKVSTLSALVAREVVPSFSLSAGLNLNFVTIDGSSSADYETSGNMGFQVSGAYTYNNVRVQLIYKNVSGDVKGTGKGANAGLNVAGTYDYNHILLTVGLIF
jgi:hypothetical protein